MSWFSTKGICVSYRWVFVNPSSIGWFLQGELIWCVVKGSGVSCRLVHENIIFELVLRREDWCLLYVGVCKNCDSILVPTIFIKKIFVVFSHLGFHDKSLCTVYYMIVYTLLINCLCLVK